MKSSKSQNEIAVESKHVPEFGRLQKYSGEFGLILKPTIKKLLGLLVSYVHLIRRVF